MVFNAKTSLIGWVLAFLIGILLWYRNIGIDRVVAITSILVAIVLLFLYGVQSGMNPLTAGRVTYSIIWIFIILGVTMVYIISGQKWVGVFTIFTAIIATISIGLIVCSDYRIDITGLEEDPPYWVMRREYIYMPILIGMGIALPYLLLLILGEWKDPVLYLILGYLVISAAVVFSIYSTSQTLSVWFYSLIILILFLWAVEMYSTCH